MSGAGGSGGDAVTSFFASKQFAVVGASSNRAKYGNKVLRAYTEHGLTAIPVHPKETEVEGLAVQQLEDIEDPANTGVSIITPPGATGEVIEKAAKLGFTKLWLQPGAENKDVLDKLASMDVEYLAGGPCVLVSLARGDHKKANM
ncbi:CoA-binding domain protein [Hondaea fermentalgiana]|uniref:CoA-binding domain protein n=1 Tax=Hondaea fermentalgiana TaxID=2315210 RepID=A0A2R5GE62_9STRA|nr:CoA-binding domain protein [Hondaea fermentalgiana]|eukprot:GBG26511.1 CoA-binding domain protein [Hondaea fermentalgiana]